MAHVQPSRTDVHKHPLRLLLNTPTTPTDRPNSTAVSQGIKVKNFSIGFGPPLLSYKAGDPEDEDAIEYTVRAIPAGGFVSFPQHYEVDDDGEIIRCVEISPLVLP